MPTVINTQTRRCFRCGREMDRAKMELVAGRESILYFCPQCPLTTEDGVPLPTVSMPAEELPDAVPGSPVLVRGIRYRKVCDVDPDPDFGPCEKMTVCELAE